jgi:hypothetical protein
MRTSHQHQHEYEQEHEQDPEHQLGTQGIWCNGLSILEANKPNTTDEQSQRQH